MKLTWFHKKGCCCYPSYEIVVIVLVVVVDLVVAVAVSDGN